MFELNWQANVTFFFVVFAIMAPLLLAKPGESPPYLGPWPWQSAMALGATVIIVGQIALLVVGMDLMAGVGLDGFRHDAAAWIGLSWLAISGFTLAAASWSYFRLNRMPALSEEPPPAELVQVTSEVSSMLGASKKYAGVRLSVRRARGPGANMEVKRDGRRSLIVIIRDGFSDWQDRPSPLSLRRAFQRFMVFHELGHFLNGDLRTAQLGASVLRGHIAFCLFTVLGSPVRILIILLAVGEDQVGNLIVLEAVGGVVCLLLLAGRVLFRRFNAEREKRADQRALFSLSEIDHGLLTQGNAPLRDLVTSYISVGITAGGHQGKLGQALRRLGKAMVPEPNAMNRVALLGQTKPTPELVQRAWWSAMIGALLGALWPTAMLLVAAVSTTAGKDLPDDLMILVLPAVSLTAPSAFFVAATEPGRMRLVSDSSDRFIASFVAVFTLSISAIVVTSLFLIPLVLTGIVSEGGLAGQWPWVRNLFLIEGAAIAIGGIFGWLVGGTGNTTAKEYPPPARFYVAIAPYFVAAFVIAIPSGAGMFYLLGWEPWHAGFSFAAIGGIAQHLLLSGILSEYRNPLTRLVPFGLISIADPIVAVRMFWRDYYIDGSGNPLRVFFSVTGIMSASMLGSVLFAIGVSLLIMSVGYDQDSALSAVFIGVIFSLPAILILPTLMNPRRNQALDADNLETIAQLCRVGEVDSRFEHHIEDLLDNIGQVFTSDQARIAVLGRPENREQLRVIASSSRLLRAAKRDGILDSWKQPIEQYLDGLNREDGAIAAWPDGPANLRWTAYGTKIICEGLLYSQSHRENSLDKLENLLAHWLAKPNPKHRSGRVWRRQDLVLAAFVLDDEGRPNLAKAAAKVILEELRYDGYPASGLSFFQIVRCLRISNTARPEQEANITRAIHERAWSLMHSNPRKEAAALLDCIEAATLLGSSPENRPHALNDLLIDLLDRFSREDAHRLRLSTL